ncbi:hypothetical protein BXA09_04805 [Campylobacter upsaliensis]|uniref:Uncharacterized protein n=1 Tax=Campylobacter upsaliensis JV21 TaxID=888826 RepID=A0A828QSL5_CAMUP|nr:hypothetical protein [Campylobacter upsaliensis]EAI4100996.1 hypothetical protein [Campylobacter jejuni]EAH4720955.1 hypothetical protein [Campylobacter upsaliensis]EAH5552959.1 hypothetical protein [Campylobacter upsaliensis]EAH8338447.1 hypothetical protein [Campylobacter upsaliensis]EAI0017209.1 hypothetical protein [Campylobacter upsaliensis]
MNFKRVKKDIAQTEEDFLQGGRGDDNGAMNSKKKTITKKPYNEKLKRKYSFSIYFDEEEYSIVKEQAEIMKMNINQYIRFKLFVTEVK